MSFNVGDRVIIRLDHEQLADPVLSQAEGASGTVTEVYERVYDPGIELYEVDLDSPIEGRGSEQIVNLPGLRKENLEASEISESRAQDFASWFKSQA